MNFKRRKKSPVKNYEDLSPEEKRSQLEKLVYLFERMRLGDYVNNFNRPWRVFMMNVLGGIGRGVGLTIGATLVIAVIFKIISAMVSWNVPYLSDAMKEAKQILEDRYAGGPRGRTQRTPITIEGKNGQNIQIKIPQSKE